MSRTMSTTARPPCPGSRSLMNQAFSAKRLEIDIALEWMRRRRVKALGGRKVDRLRSGGRDIAARRVEMGVRGDLAVRSADQVEEDRLDH
jgi:hypothetical protein